MYSSSGATNQFYSVISTKIQSIEVCGRKVKENADLECQTFLHMNF